MKPRRLLDRQVVWDENETLERPLGPASCLGRDRCNDTWALAGTGKLFGTRGFEQEKCNVEIKGPPYGTGKLSPGRCRELPGRCVLLYFPCVFLMSVEFCFILLMFFEDIAQQLQFLLIFTVVV